MNQKTIVLLSKNCLVTSRSMIERCVWWKVLCFSFEGEEEYCGGPAEAAPIRDRANCQDVWRPRDHSADAVHKVRSACQTNASISSTDIVIVHGLRENHLTSIDLFFVFVFFFFIRDGRMLFDYLSEKHNVSFEVIMVYSHYSSCILHFSRLRWVAQCVFCFHNNQLSLCARRIVVKIWKF